MISRQRRSMAPSWLFTLGLAGLAANGCSSPVTGSSRPEARTVSESGGGVAALGHIEPRGGVIAIAGPPGTRVGALEVAEGQEVKAGDVLFRLDSYPTLKAAAEAARAQADDAGALYDLEVENQEQLEREFALKERQVLELEPLDIEAQAEKVGALGKALAKAELDRDRLARLRESGSEAISAQEVEAARLQADTAQAELRAAQALLRKAKQAHELSEARLAFERKSLGIATRRAQLASQHEAARANARAAEAQLAAAEIKAPVAGQVLRILTHVGESISGHPVLEMGDTGDMVVVAEVSELEILRLRKASKAGPLLTRVSALGDQLELAGWLAPGGIGRVVGKNAMMSLDPTAPADHRVVEVEIVLDETSVGLARDLSNLQVDVEIDLAPHSGQESESGVAGRTDAVEVVRTAP